MKKISRAVFNQRTLSNLIVVISGILFFLLLSNFVAVKESAGKYLGIIKPFIIGVGFAYLLNMPVRFFERKLFKPTNKYKRAFSILLSYILFFIIITILLWLVIPQLGNSIGTLINIASRYLNDLDGTINNAALALGIPVESIAFVHTAIEDIINKLVDIVQDLIPWAANIIYTIGTSIISTVTALIASIYMLGAKEKLIGQIKKIIYAIFPERAGNGIVRVSRNANAVFSGFISGKLLDSAIIGGICFVFMMVMVMLNLVTLPIATLVSVVIGVSNIIPFFGPFIGAVPSGLIILMFNPWACVVFVIFVILLQQFDGNILGPKILGDSTGLPALWVLIAIIVGGGLFGFAGMIMGVPTTAVIYSLASELVAKRLEKKGFSAQDEKFAMAAAPVKVKADKHKKDSAEKESK